LTRANDSLATQPYEALTVTIRGKYFFDPYFGGALIPGQRNQFYPIDTFSAFTYGAVPRRFSPLNVDVRYRPTQHLFADYRGDIDTRGGGLRAMAATAGYTRANLVEAFATFYYTRAVELVPALRQYANPLGQEPGTLRGSQWRSVHLRGESRARTVRRHVHVLRFSEASVCRQSFADQFDSDARVYLEVLRYHGAVLHVQCGSP
jgi:hypothetical protein